MKMEKIDINFKKEEFKKATDKACYTIPCDKFDLYGVFYDEDLHQFVRMDNCVAKKVSDSVGYLSTHTSGGRIRFSTNSSTIGISVTYPSLVQMPHMPLTGSCGFALVEKLEDTYKTVSVFRPNHDEKNGYTGEVKIEGEGVHEYILFFPLYNGVSDLKIYLDSSATLYEPEKYRNIAPILYYGASVDQGGCASRPDCSYTAMLSKWNNIDFINLGFSGNCKGEPLMAEYLTGIDCSLFFMAYDGNAPDAEYLEKTHFPFYQIYRKAKKDVPIVFMSVPCFDNFPNSDKRREVIYKSYLKARENGDNNVYFIDGETLFGKKDREICTVEGIHPNDLGFYRIAKVIEKLYHEIGL
ncbi:MAG: SGNH/GDSL hydrolase family protein [Clostridia bacterium]|nr:SGNH/GDSL hydrolase family protein [Clostridia bacterium]